jgi:ribosome-binding ATPase YchF (GTP1/OBG family)
MTFEVREGASGAAREAPHPFTTIEPNLGVMYFLLRV